MMRYANIRQEMGGRGSNPLIRTIDSKEAIEK
jgi:hypothetical protein